MKHSILEFCLGILEQSNIKKARPTTELGYKSPGTDKNFRFEFWRCVNFDDHAVHKIVGGATNEGESGIQAHSSRTCLKGKRLFCCGFEPLGEPIIFLR